MKIQFLGATKTVTGSKYLVTADKTNLLVDCGLFQGQKMLRLRNWNPPPINPSEIDYLLLTHAHIDHSGYIPLFIKNGFRGKIICTEATRDLCAILLPDSGYLQEEEARYANLKKSSKHHPALPLYTRADAEASLTYFQTIPFDQRFNIDENLSFCFRYAGHILGASLIRIEHYETSLLFTGDLGRLNDPIMYPPKDPPESDYIVIESTYGNRLHENTDPKEQLKKIINDTVKRNGIILIPAFAVGRAQTLLYYINQLKTQNEIPNIPVYLDSPMATDATELFCHHISQHRLTHQQSADVCRTATYIRSVNESIALNDKKDPMIIISASGMATGGRVLHHIKNLASNPRNSIVFTGFQANGTRGDIMVRGEKEVKIFGEMIPIHAEVSQLENISAHADYQDILFWLSHLQKKPPRKVFITHGEEDSAQALKSKIEAQFHWNCIVPEYLEKEELI